MLAEPNPFSDGTMVAVSIPTESRVEVSMFDVEGRLVRKVETRILNAGEHKLWWDGRDEAGRPVAGGLMVAISIVWLLSRSPTIGVSER